MLLALLPAASAHVPHDIAGAVAAPPSLDDAAPWWLWMDPQGSDLLLRSDDGGTSWAFVGGPALAERPVDLVMAGGVPVVLGATRLWYGEDWAVATLPGDVTDAAGGDTLVLGGPGGLWEGSPDALVQALDVPIDAVFEGGLALASDGHAWRRDQAGWSDLGATPPDTIRLAGAYAGTSDGAVFRLDADGWTACGALPDADPPDIVAMAADGDTIWATPAAHGPFVSTDGCATWEDRAADDPRFTGEGAATSPDQAWRHVYAAGDRLALVGWDGIFVSDDGGRAWTAPPTIPPDYTRGIARLGDRLLVGQDLAGVLRTADGGATFDAPSLGLPDPNVQSVQVGDDVVYAAVGHDGYASTDEGVTWTAFSGGLDPVQHLVPLGDGEVWVVPGDEGDPLMTTRDGGATWAAVEPPVEAAHVEGVVRVGDLVCVAARQPAALACGEPWTVLRQGRDDANATPPVTWPADAPTRIVFADDDGAYAYDLDGALVAEVPFDDAPLRMTAAPDGTLWLGTRAGRLWSSDDGGDTWVDAGVTLTAQPNVLRALDGVLLVGTDDGTWMLRDGELARWAAYARIDDHGPGLICDGSCPDALDAPAFGLGSIQPLPSGSALEGATRGSRIRVLGRGSGGVLFVDEAPVADLREGGGHVLADVDGLDDGWHALRLEGGGDLEVDAVEAWGDGEVLDLTEAAAAPAPFRACGCHGGGGGAALLLVVSLRGRRGWGRAARARGARPPRG